MHPSWVGVTKGLAAPNGPGYIVMTGGTALKKKSLFAQTGFTASERQIDWSSE
jgi:hypothetical protein